MSYQVITDFRQGLDARKYKLALPPGTLLKGRNGHITQGGEFEKRKSFVPVTVPAPYAGKVYGLQPAESGIYLFGGYTIVAPTFQRSRTANVATVYIPRLSIAAGAIAVTTPINVSGMGGAGYNVTNVAVTVRFDDGAVYVQLSYPSIGPDEALTNDFTGRVIRTADVIAAPYLYQLIVHPAYAAAGAGAAAPTLSDIVWSTLYGDQPFVLAKFSDGSVFPYYAGVYLPDGALGLEFLGVDASANTLLTKIAEKINTLTNYTATMTGFGVLDIFSVPTTLNGTPFSAAVTESSAGGAVVAQQQTTGLASTAAAQAVGSFQIVSAGAGSVATGTITNSGDINMNDGDTLTIGTTVYRFKSVMAQAYDVKLSGAGPATTLTSLAAAINGTGVVGTDYFAGTLAHPTVRCTALNTTVLHRTLSIAAITGGTAGNAIALSSTASTRLVVSAATLTGAVDSKVNQIVVNGATNLLAAPVAFATDEPTTAAAVALAINANPASGYQATSDGSTVTIMAQVAGAGPNGYSVQVQAQGAIVCGSGAFSLTGSGFTLDYCKANGVDLMNDSILLANELVMTYPQVTGQVLADFCRAVANNINSGTATHGYLAHCAGGSISVYVGKATTISTEAQRVLEVSVTAPAGQTGAAIPVTVTPLSVALDTNALAIGVGGKSGAVTAAVQGGVAPFTYRWSQVGSNVIGVRANSPKSAQTTFSQTGVSPTLQTQIRTYNKLPATQQADYLKKHPAVAAYLAATSTNQVTAICTVTDALGEQADSDAVYITLLGNSI